MALEDLARHKLEWKVGALSNLGNYISKDSKQQDFSYGNVPVMPATGAGSFGY